MVDGLLFCAALTGRRGGHTPFVQAEAETSDTGAEAVKPNPRCSRRSHSRRVGTGVGDESMESRSVAQLLQNRGREPISHHGPHELLSIAGRPQK